MDVGPEPEARPARRKAAIDTRGPSFFAIEEALAELMRAREEVEDPDEVKAVEATIAEYFAREVAKVDGIRDYYRMCEMAAAAHAEEAERQRVAAAVWERRAEIVKEAAGRALEASGKRVVEGKRGKISIKGNGGKLPVLIPVEDLVPDEYARFEVRMKGSIWSKICQKFPWLATLGPDELRVARSIDRGAVLAALEADCPECAGTGTNQWMLDDLHASTVCPECNGGRVRVYPGTAIGQTETCRKCKGSGAATLDVCPACNGSKHAGVPGATLGERGKHVEIR